MRLRAEGRLAHGEDLSAGRAARGDAPEVSERAKEDSTA